MQATFLVLVEVQVSGTGKPPHSDHPVQMTPSTLQMEILSVNLTLLRPPTGPAYSRFPLSSGRQGHPSLRDALVQQHLVAAHPCHLRMAHGGVVYDGIKVWILGSTCERRDAWRFLV
jgi:hypothetical protein